DVADHEVDAVALDQLAGLLHAGADVVGGVLDQQFDLAAEDAALGVDLLDGEPGAHHLVAGGRGVNTGQGIDHAHLDRGFTARLDDEGRGELERAERGGALDQGAAVEFRVEYGRVHGLSDIALLIFLLALGFGRFLGNQVLGTGLGYGSWLVRSYVTRPYVIRLGLCKAMPGASRRRASFVKGQAGHLIVQPLTGPAAFSPGTGFFTVNILSGSPCGGCASPTNTVLISSWSPARYSGEPGCSATSGGSLKPDKACASFGASSVFSWLATSAKVWIEA